MRDCKVGLDFGTTFSTVSTLVNNSMYVLRLGDSAYIPTCIAITPGGEAIIGGAAEVLSGDDTPHCFFYDLKRWVGVDDNTFKYAMNKIRPKYVAELVEGEVYLTGINKGYSIKLSVKQLIKAYIETIVRLLASTYSLRVIDLNQSVPADYKNAQRLAARSVLKALSFPCRRIINEPSAAAVYCVSRYPNYNYFLVYDFGGGTFDVSLIGKYKSYVTVIDTEGDSFLGGRDIDKSIEDYLVGKYNVKKVIPATYLALIKEECNNTNKSIFTILFDDGSVQVVEFSKSELEKCVRPFVERSIKLINDVVVRNKLTSGVIYMVGGSSLLQPVQDMVRSYASTKGLTLVADQDMRSAVSYGCSVLHKLEDNKEIVYIDCNSHPLSDISFNCDPEPIIRKPMSIPYTHTVKMRHDRPLKTIVNIYEGSNLFMPENDWLISSNINTTDFAKVGEEYSKVYEYDIDGIITLKIRNEVTGKMFTLPNSFTKSDNIKPITFKLTQLSNTDDLATLTSLLGYHDKNFERFYGLFNVPTILIKEIDKLGGFKTLYRRLKSMNANF